MYNIWLNLAIIGINTLLGKKRELYFEESAILGLVLSIFNLLNFIELEMIILLLVLLGFSPEIVITLVVFGWVFKSFDIVVLKSLKYLFFSQLMTI